MDTYDDNEQLVRYILTYYKSLKTPLEHKASRAIPFLSRSESAEPKHAEKLIAMSGVDDPAVEKLLIDGFQKFHQRVVDRIIRDHEELVINRCPKCERILRTPKAQQCLWCNHSWHEAH